MAVQADNPCTICHVPNELKSSIQWRLVYKMERVARIGSNPHPRTEPAERCRGIFIILPAVKTLDVDINQCSMTPG